MSSLYELELIATVEWTEALLRMSLADVRLYLSPRLFPEDDSKVYKLVSQRHRVDR